MSNKLEIAIAIFTLVSSLILLSITLFYLFPKIIIILANWGDKA